MKKLINKLFEWFGYKLLSKNEYDSMNEEISRTKTRFMRAINDNIKSGRYSFEIMEGRDCFYIGFIFSRIDFLFIKTFPFDDDKDYARLCAEELCEMLNQKI